MNTRAKIIAAAFALAAAAGVNAQTSSVDKAFTANGQNCLEIVWSEETLDKGIRRSAVPARKSCRRMARAT